MKVKITLIVILSTLLAITGAAYVVWPQYKNRQVATEYIQKGYSQLNTGEITQGLANITHAINHVGDISRLPDNLGDNMDDALLGIASRYPLKSHLILDYLQDRDIVIACNHRLNMYNYMLRQSVENYKGNKSLVDLEQALFLAALWGGKCNVDKNQIKKFRKIFDFYKKKEGDNFRKSPWMGLAYAGKPIVDSPDVPKMKEEAGQYVEKETMATGAPAAMATVAAGGGVVGMVAGAAAAASASEDARARAVEKSVGPPINAAAKPGINAAKRPTQHLSEDLMKKVAQPTAQAPLQKKPEGFIDRVKSKVTGLFSKGKTPAAQSSPGKSAPAHDNSIKTTIENAEKIIRDVIKVYDVSLLEMNFTEDGSVLHITFESSNIGNKELMVEMKNLLDTIYESKQQNPALPLKYIVIHLKDMDGEIKAIWDIEYKDFVDYKRGKLNGKEFRSRWREQIL